MKQYRYTALPPHVIRVSRATYWKTIVCLCRQAKQRDTLYLLRERTATCQLRSNAAPLATPDGLSGIAMGMIRTARCVCRNDIKFPLSFSFCANPFHTYHTKRVSHRSMRLRQCACTSCPQAQRAVLPDSVTLHATHSHQELKCEQRTYYRSQTPKRH